MALIHSTNQALLDGQLNLLDNTFGYIKSMALKAALDLRIADAIDHHGGAATLTQIADRVTLHRSKISSLRRLMRVLIVSGVFGVQSAEGSSELLYVLTPTSSLLVGPRNLVSITTMSLSPYFVASYLELGTWFHQELPDPCIFKLAHGEPLWKLAEHDASFDALINDGMVSDTSFIMDIAIKESGGVFQGITSLIDVAGGRTNDKRTAEPHSTGEAGPDACDSLPRRARADFLAPRRGTVDRARGLGLLSAAVGGDALRQRHLRETGAPHPLGGGAL
uniref:Uncharacterized protein n=1 Tax=Avena sativa TaxID=4498 RepID=A0ACD5XI02_AVESA